MQRFLAVVIGILLVAAAAAVVIANLPERVEKVPVNELALRPNQSEAVGTATSVNAGPAFPTEPLATPTTIRGGGATIANALVGTTRATIVWDGGRPLVIEGQGSIDLAASTVRVDAAGFKWTLDGGRAIAPGAYRIATPVAVGTTGLATPRDSVSFTADHSTSITFRPGASVTTPLKPLELNGPGTVRIEGSLRQRKGDGDAAPTSVASFTGSYRVGITPGDAGLQVVALFEEG